MGENRKAIRVEYLPKGSSDYNAVEECWRQGSGILDSGIKVLSQIL
jgi:hypothetical protein